MSLIGCEKIIVRLHKHPIVFFTRVSLFVLLLLVPAGMVLFNEEISQAVAGEYTSLITELLAGILALYLFLFIFYTFFNYILDEWALTEAHIINIEQDALFDRKVAKQELEKIQDVQAEVRGILPTLFNYGNVYIQSAGTMERIVFYNTPNPHALVDLILRLVENLKQQNSSLHEGAAQQTEEKITEDPELENIIRNV